MTLARPPLDPPTLLAKDRAALLVVDMQEAFRPVIDDFDSVAASIATLLQGARVLGVPVIVTEQYPRGLGATVAEIGRHLAGVVPLEKSALSATAAESFDLGGRNQVILCGIETHICVYQSAVGLIEAGAEVHLVRDGVASRKVGDRDVGLARMAELGVITTSVEMSLFEMLGVAGSPEFKEIQGLVR